jgi:ABC-type metal ion transport system substrate-binding protein
MPAEPKTTKKDIKRLQKKLKLIAREVRKLDCQIRDVAQAVANGNFRML